MPFIVLELPLLDLRRQAGIGSSQHRIVLSRIGGIAVRIEKVVRVAEPVVHHVAVASNEVPRPPPFIPSLTSSANARRVVASLTSVSRSRRAASDAVNAAREEVALAGVIVPLARLETALDVDELALRQVQAAG